jgi:DNA-binding NtrC family response regulator
MSQQPTVLLIDDDKDMRWAMRHILGNAGFSVAEAEAGGPALELASRRTPDTVLLDMQMPGLGGDEVLRRLRRLAPNLPIIVVTGHGTIPGAVSAIQEGAYEYITKPFRNEHLVDTVQRAVSRRATASRVTGCGVGATLTAVMGQSKAIQSLVDQIDAVVSTNYSVLIQGETGTGKEVVARCLHQHSRRASRPLVVVDCGTIAESLINSEFFGHEKGAYTGATTLHRGWFEVAANGGTMFLDEIGNLASVGQKALLRALEERSIHRVGGTQKMDVDLRVIAASNENLKELTQTGRFREDLFFRLGEYIITLPPLRSRPEDIAFLSKRFLTQACESLERPPVDISPAAVDLLCSYHWPGNVRELRNVMRRAVLMASDTVTPNHLADSFARDTAPATLAGPTEAGAASLRQKIRGQVGAIERDAVLGALKQAGGNKAEAARLLGIDYKTYRTKLKKLVQRQGISSNA